MRMETTDWHEYIVGELFLCDTTNGVPSKSDLSGGNIPYITRSTANNGYNGTCGNKEHLVKGNCITIGAEGFTAFYQPNDFVPGNKVYTLRHKKLAENIALFLCSALNTLSSQYSFSEARVLDKIKEEIIKLPSILSTPPRLGEGHSDWEYRYE